MKILNLLLLLVSVGLFNCCDKNDNEIIPAGVNFSSKEDIADILVGYNEIIGYDSVNYIFRIEKEAWKRIKNKITPITPDPLFGFNLVLNNQIIYSTRYVPGYYSMSFDDIVTFVLSEPDLVHITLGYPSPVFYKSEDPRNDYRIIEQLENDNKLIGIDLAL